MAGDRIQLKRGLLANWGTQVLTEAEYGLVLDDIIAKSDTIRYKIGDGVTDWNGLPFQSAAAGSSTFLGLTDVFEADYTGHAGEVATVNPGETGLIFSPAGSGSGTVTEVTGAAPITIGNVSTVNPEVQLAAAAGPSTDGYMTGADKAKLDGIEAGAEVNNISDVDATDLTDGGETTLHTHPVGSGVGDVVGPAGGVVATEVAVYDDTTGKLIGGSGVLVTGTGSIEGTNTGDQDISGKLDANAPITPDTKTKITYDADGLVTAGADAVLDDLGDVTITTPADTEVLTYDTGVWKNLPATGGGDTVTGVAPIQVDDTTTPGTSEVSIDTFTGSTPGAVPDGTAAGSTKVLQSDGTWVDQTGGGGGPILTEQGQLLTATDTLDDQILSIPTDSDEKRYFLAPSSDPLVPLGLEYKLDDALQTFRDTNSGDALLVYAVGDYNLRSERRYTDQDYIDAGGTTPANNPNVYVYTANPASATVLFRNDITFTETGYQFGYDPDTNDILSGYLYDKTICPAIEACYELQERTGRDIYLNMVSRRDADIRELITTTGGTLLNSLITRVGSGNGLLPAPLEGRFYPDVFLVNLGIVDAAEQLYADATTDVLGAYVYNSANTTNPTAGQFSFSQTTDPQDTLHVSNDVYEALAISLDSIGAGDTLVFTDQASSDSITVDITSAATVGATVTTWSVDFSTVVNTGVVNGETCNLSGASVPSKYEGLSVSNEKFAANFLGFMTSMENYSGQPMAKEYFTQWYIASIPRQWNFFGPLWKGWDFVDSATDEFLRIISSASMDYSYQAVIDNDPAALFPSDGSFIASGLAQMGENQADASVIGPVPQAYPATPWDIRPQTTGVLGNYTFNGYDGGTPAVNGFTITQSGTRLNINNTSTPDMSTIPIGTVLTFASTTTANEIVVTIASTISTTETTIFWDIDFIPAPAMGAELCTLTGLNTNGQPTRVLTGNPSDVFSNNYGGQVAINVDDPDNIKNGTFVVKTRDSKYYPADPLSEGDVAFNFFTPEDTRPPVGSNSGGNDQSVSFAVDLKNTSDFLIPGLGFYYRLAQQVSTHGIVFWSGFGALKAESDFVSTGNPNMVINNMVFRVSYANGYNSASMFDLKPTQGGGATDTIGTVYSAAIQATSGTGNAVGIDSNNALFKGAGPVATLAESQWLGASTMTVEPSLTGSTTDNAWTTIHTVPVPVGYKKRAVFVVTAEQTNGVNFFEATYSGIAWEDGGIAVADTGLRSKSGGSGPMGFQLVAVGATVEVQVRGAVAEDWDWKVQFMDKDL